MIGTQYIRQTRAGKIRRIRIEVTSENGNETTGYELTFVKDKSAIGGDSNASDQGDSDSAAAAKTGDDQNALTWLLIAFRRLHGNCCFGKS